MARFFFRRAFLGAVWVFVWFAGGAAARGQQLDQLGSYGAGSYSFVMPYGHYAVCCDPNAGVDIIEVADMARPVKVARYSTAGYSLSHACLSGDYLYLCMLAQGLWILDLHDPERPVRVGVYDPVWSAAQVCVSGPYAYVLAYVYGLAVVDVHDPAHPALLSAPISPGGQLNIQYYDLSAWDHYVYVPSDKGLLVYDVANAAHPVVAKTVSLSDSISRFVARDGYGYATTQTALQAWDLGNPTAPARIGQLALPLRAQRLDVDGSLALMIAASSFNRLLLADVSDPAHPVLLGEMSLESANDVKAEGGVAFVAGWGRLYLVDLSDPRAPICLSRVWNPGNFRRFAAYGDHYYVLGAGKMYVYDLSQPTAPRLATTVTVAASGIQVVGNRLFLLQCPGFSIFALVDAENPQLIGKSSMYCASDFTFLGNRVILWSGSYFQVLDISDPANPSVVGSSSLNAVDETQAVAVGAVIYLVDGMQALHAFDFTDPLNPLSVAEFTEPAWIVNGLHRCGNYLYVTHPEGDTIEVLDVSDPVHPVLAASPCLEGWQEFSHLTSEGATGVMVGSTPGHDGLLLFLDLADPLQPVVCGTANMADSLRVYDLQVHDGLTVYVETNSSLSVLDSSHPSTPPVVAEYDAGGIYSQVVAVKEYALLLEKARGLQVLDVRDARIPRLAASVRIDNPVEMVVRGGRAFVASTFDGLYILDVSDPAQPRELGHYNPEEVPSGIFCTLLDADLGGGLVVLRVGMPEQGLLLLDTRDPTRPTVLATLPVYGHPYFLGTRLLDVSATWFLAYDLTDIRNPRQIAENHEYGGESVVFQGNVAYFSSSGEGLRIVDLSDPGHPVLLGGFQLPGHGSYSCNCNRIAVRDGFAYVGAGECGLQVFDVRNPAAPSFDWVWDSPGVTGDVALDDHFIYAACGVSDFAVLRLFPFRGDLDENRVVDVRDLSILLRSLAGNLPAGQRPFDAPAAAADMNGDGALTAVDATLLKRVLLE